MKEMAQRPIRAPVERARAETYLLLSLTAFAISVIAIRFFLELTGYPQLGNSELHIAHALWGGMLLLAAAILPLILANRWAYALSAIFSGLGMGLFIDEIGKFITQRNDYFYPPAAPVVYAFFLLLVLMFFLVRRSRASSSRAEMYLALAGLRELLDNNFDPRELEQLLARLKRAQGAEQAHVAGLAHTLHSYLQDAEIPLVPYQPSIRQRFMAALERGGQRLGRRRHRRLILLAMVILVLGMTTAIVLPLFKVLAPEAIGRGLLAPEAGGQWLLALRLEDDVQTAGSRVWFYLRILLEGVVALIALASITFLASGKEQEGIDAALIALLLSLTGVVLLSFYLDQFSATISALFEFGVLLLVLGYRHWYVQPELPTQES